jgi:hypothetical protein
MNEEILPVVHADIHNRLLEIERPRDNAPAIIPAKINLELLSGVIGDRVGTYVAVPPISNPPPKIHLNQNVLEYDTCSMLRVRRDVRLRLEAWSRDLHL